jgi:hypothetical protein
VTIRSRYANSTATNAFETTMFSSTPEINGWTYINGLFACIETGKWLVSYL